EQVWKVVLGEKRYQEAKARYEAEMGSGGAAVHPDTEEVDLEKVREELTAKLKRPATDDDLYSHLMYPQVFASFEKHRHEYGDVSVLPTPAFFYGLQLRQEISATIEAGKTLIIRLVNVSEPEKDGRRTITYELNGVTRETFVADKSMAAKVKHRPKADLNDPRQVPAPIPGLIVSIAVSIGHKVNKGDKLLMMEAMKMQATVSAPVDGVVEELHVNVGEAVQSKDLLLKLRA
ncbi:MAG: biotin/lipoyl-containing protein, partial [Verrucomicrobiota bacterium]